MSGSGSAIQSLQNKKGDLNSKTSNIYCGTYGLNHIALCKKVWGEVENLNYKFFENKE